MDENKMRDGDRAPARAGGPQRGNVVQLLERRQELRGVYPMADLLADNVGWIV